VTTGNNDYTPSQNSQGFFPATTGYDMASGLGTPNFAYRGSYYPGLAAQMCFEYGTKLDKVTITSVSPKEGPSGSKASVLIRGSGFLPIAGADELEVGKNWITVSCATTTRCDASLPATKPGRVNLVMSVEDLTLSKVTAAAHFSFVAAKPPTVRLRTPLQPVQLSKTIVIRYRASDALPIMSYDVRFAVAPWSSKNLGSYVYPAAWQGTTHRSETRVGAPGKEYCFNVRARTIGGTASAWSSPECTTIPLGSKALAPLTPGWTRHRAAGYYLDSYVETTTDNAELYLTNAEANQIALVVTKCPDCGRLTIYLNGRTLKTISTYSPTVRHGVIVTLPAFSLRRTTIVLRAASKGMRIIIEGLAVS
jgi:hypothetical protein